MSIFCWLVFEVHVMKILILCWFFKQYYNRCCLSPLPVEVINSTCCTILTFSWHLLQKPTNKILTCSCLLVQKRTKYWHVHGMSFKTNKIYAFSLHLRQAPGEFSAAHPYAMLLHTFTRQDVYSQTVTFPKNIRSKIVNVWFFQTFPPRANLHKPTSRIQISAQVVNFSHCAHKHSTFHEKSDLACVDSLPASYFQKFNWKLWMDAFSRLCLQGQVSISLSPGFEFQPKLWISHTVLANIQLSTKNPI